MKFSTYNKIRLSRHQKRHIYTSKETYIHITRDLYTHQKRPLHTRRFVDVDVKRDLYTHQKKPIYTSKETC